MVFITISNILKCRYSWSKEYSWSLLLLGIETVPSGVAIAAARISNSIFTARSLPTGWALKDDTGRKTHVNHKTIEMLAQTSLYAQKLLLIICCQSVVAVQHQLGQVIGEADPVADSISLSCEHPKFMLLKANLFSENLEIACLCASALYGGDNC